MRIQIIRLARTRDRKHYYKAGLPSSRKLAGALLAKFAILVSVVLAGAAIFAVPAYAENVHAKYGDQEWTVDYTFSGNISSVRIDPDFNSLVFMIATSQDSEQELVLSLPRELIDARTNDTDSEFLVVAGGQNIPYQEIQSSDSMRQIRISVPPASTEFEIVGTRVVPEFPALQVAAVTGTVLAVLLVLGRTYLMRPHGC